MSTRTSTHATLPAFDGTAALSAGPARLVLLEGGLGRAGRDAARPPRAPRTRAQEVALVGCAALVVFALVLASSVADKLLATGVSDRLSELPASTVVVGQGDTLWEIAEKSAPGEDARAVVAWIQEANGLEGGLLVPGQELVVPGGALS
ncbi:LysM peptidoglycan-binding domain-containing protein [Thermophilibacter mediterraneus]|uniref:LysM peptidoglycan-binding domain-containing protein n=1 Tax=Thermophilibacter mediterraneus TaxID=1871031 RepID=UPI003209E288